MKIGADVELIFTDLANTRLIPARDVVNNSTSVRFGVDGCSSTAELRPREDEDPRKVIASFARSMKAEVKRRPILNTLKWHGGSYIQGNPIGGHVHFGTGSEPTTQMIDYLDSLLAMFLFMMEDSQEHMARMRSGYGNLTSWRRQAWGFEYRTLPSFITEKKLALGVLSLAKVIVEHVHRGNISAEERQAFEAIKVVQQDRDDFYQGRKDRIARSMRKRRLFIRKFMPEHKQYRAIGFIFKSQKKAIKGEYTMCKKDIKETWGVAIEMPKFTPQELLDKQIGEVVHA